MHIGHMCTAESSLGKLESVPEGDPKFQGVIVEATQSSQIRWNVAATSFQLTEKLCQNVDNTDA